VAGEGRNELAAIAEIETQDMVTIRDAVYVWGKVAVPQCVALEADSGIVTTSLGLDAGEGTYDHGEHPDVTGALEDPAAFEKRPG
jgi:hypothetical protein